MRVLAAGRREGISTLVPLSARLLRSWPVVMDATPMSTVTAVVYDDDQHGSLRARGSQAFSLDVGGQFRSIAAISRDHRCPAGDPGCPKGWHGASMISYIGYIDPRCCGLTQPPRRSDALT